MTARWAENYKVTVIVNEPGYYGSTDNRQIVFKAAKGKSLDVWGRPSYPWDYVFDAFYYDEQYTRRYSDQLNSFSSRTDTTLYARVAKKVTVTFDANGGYLSGDPDRLTTEKEVGSGIIFGANNAPKAMRDDKAFVGWSLNSSGTPLIDLDQTSFTENTTLYAAYKNGVKVVLDAREGQFSGGSSVRTFYLTDDKAIQDLYNGVHDPQRPGYRMMGWYRSTDFKEESYFSSDVYKYNFKTDTTLYARYAEEVIITFDANGGYYRSNPSQTKNEVRVVKNEFFNQSVSSPVRKNKAFVAWYDNPGCNGEPETFEDYLVNERKTFYAKWDDAYTVTYHLNGGTIYNNPGETVSYTQRAGTYHNIDGHSKPTKEGYIYNGLYYDQGCTRKVDRNRILVTDNIDLYVGWTDNVYTVTFDLNGGNWNGTSAMTILPGENLGANWSDPYKDDYAFDGWRSTLTGNVISSLDYFTPTGSDTLVALWTDDFYRVTLHLNGGYIHRGNSNVYDDITYNIKKGMAVKVYSPSYPYSDGKSYNFDGWYYNSSLTNLYGDSLYDYVPQGNIDFYAKWSLTEKYRVTVNMNGGYYQYGDRKIYSDYEFKTKGTLSSISTSGFYYKDDTKAFKGFSTSKNGSILSDTYQITKDMTLYAIYDSNVYHITIDYNGGYSETRNVRRSSESYTILKGQSLRSDNFPKHPQDYINAGYTTVKDDYSTKIDYLHNYVPTSDVTLYVYWIPDYCYINFVAEDGVLSNNAKQIITAYPGATFYFSNYYYYATSNNGKVFVGWYDNPEFEGQAYSGDVIINEDLTLYAKFADNYIVTFDANGGEFADGRTLVEVPVSSEVSAIYKNQFPVAADDSEYSIVSWNTKRDGTGVTYDYRTMYIYNDLILYAQWDKDVVDVNSVTINQKGYGLKRIKVGSTLNLTATVKPDDATYKDLVWTSSDSSVATINQSGVVTARKAGKTIITAKTVYGNVSDTMDLVVDEDDGVSRPFAVHIIDSFNGTLYENETGQMSYMFEPGLAVSDVRWSVNDTSIATIDQIGVLTAVREGEVIVTVETVDGYIKDSKMVRVLRRNDEMPKHPNIIFDGVRYNNIVAYIYVGDNIQLTCEDDYGSLMSNSELLWKSENEDVATIDENGNLRALAVGQTTVYAYHRYSKQFTGLNFMVLDPADINVIYCLRGTNNDYYPQRNVQIVNESALYDFYFEPYEAKDEYKVIEVDQNYLDEHNLQVNVSYVYENNTQLDVVDKIVYLEVTGSTPGFYNIPYRCGKDLSHSDTLNVEIITESQAVKVTYNANGGKVFNPMFTYSKFEDKAKEVVTLVYKKDELFDGVRYADYMKALNDNGYAFINWYTDLSDESTRLDLNYNINHRYIENVSENLVLYAKWDDAYVTTFDANGGNIYTSVNGESVGSKETLQVSTPKGKSYYYSNQAIVPDGVYRQGYQFTGWYYDREGSQYYAGGNPRYHVDDFVDLYNQIPDGNNTYYAGWIKTYFLVLDFNGGTYNDSSEKYNIVSDPYKVHDLTGYIPEYPGKVFVGWYYDKALTRPISDPTAFVATAQTTLYAKYVDEYYTVTYNLGAGTAYLDSDNYGSVVTRKVGKGYPIGVFPTTVSYIDSSKKFNDKWYLDAACTQEIDVMEYIPTSDITIYAGYSDMVTVTFDLNGGYYGYNVNNKTYNYYIESGSKIEFPYEIKNSDDTLAFDGWYLENTFVNRVDLNTFTATENKTLYARWSTNKVNVTLSANGGVFDNYLPTKNISVTRNSSFAELDKPLVLIDSDGSAQSPIEDELNHINIIGWAFDEAGENLVDESYVFTSDVTLYAVWMRVIRVMGVEIVDAPTTVTFGNTYQLLVQVLPTDATNKNVTWSVDDEEVAAITNNGILIPKKAGIVNVTVTTDDRNYSDTVTINVVDNSVRVTSIELSRTEIDLSLNATIKNNATVYPEHATDKTLTWTSADSDIASVDSDGYVTGNKIGTTIITVTSADGNVSAQFTVNVFDSYVDITKLNLQEKNVYLNKGNRKTLAYTIVPENATNKNVTWSTSDANVVNVDQNGTIIGVGEGTAYVYAIANGSDPANYPLVGDYCVVTVTDTEIKVNTLSINVAEKNMVVGDKDVLTVTALPENATDKSVKWTSSDEDVVTVDEQGNIEALAEGTATITVSTLDDSVYDECVVTVTALRIPVTNLTLDKQTLKIKVPGSEKLTATIEPDEATDKELVWTSSDIDVATVDENGNVTAVAEGSATITVSTTDGSEISATCAVVVEPADEEVKIVFDEPEIIVNVGKNVSIAPRIIPDSHDQSDFTYEYEENEFFSFDETTGTITGIKANANAGTIRAKLNGVDLSGIQQQLNTARENLDAALLHTQTIKTDLDAAENAKKAAETEYANKQKEVESAQRELDERNNLLRTAQAQLDAAQKDYDAKEANLQDAQDKLQEAMENGGDTAALLENAQKAKDDAEARYLAAQQQIAKGTLGFFEDNGSETAVALLEDRVARQSQDNWGKTNIGKKHDATSLENMKESIRLIKVGNKHRENDDNFDLKPLRIDDALMAIAEIQTNASKVQVAHTRLYLAWENLSWGNNDPYSGWYTTEKKVYDYAMEKGISEAEAVRQLREQGVIGVGIPGYGHYTNIASPDAAYTGLATATDSPIVYNGKCHGQVFFYYQLGENSYSVDEYEKLFNDYCDKINKELADSKSEYDEAVRVLEEIQKNGGIDSAITNLIAAAQDRVDKATEALETARVALENAEANVDQIQEYVDQDTLALQQAEAEQEEAKNIKDTKTAEYNLVLGQYNDALQEEAAAQAAYDRILETSNGYIAECKVKVVQPATKISFAEIEQPIELQIEHKYDLKIKVVFEPGDTTITDLNWVSSDDSIATVDEDGNVIGVSSGEVTITATTIDGSNLSASVTFKIIPNGAFGEILPEDRPASYKDIPKALWAAGVDEEVDFDPTIKAYTQVFRVYDHNKLLKEGEDYTVSYRNNKKVGEAYIVVKGKGNYTGTFEHPFKIVDKGLDDLDVVIILNKDTFVYTGKPQKANISSIEYKGVKLKNNTDYTAEYADPKSSEVGTYTITITLKGNYSGTLTAQYRIINNATPMSNSSISGIKNMTYNGSLQLQEHDKLVVKNAGNTLVEGKDFTITYKNNIDAGTAYIIFEGCGNYVGSVIKSFKIASVALNSKNVTIDPLPADTAYTGKPVTPECELRVNNNLLIEDVDYTVTYKNNINAGTATITYKGIGNYSGSLNKTFKINKLDITDKEFEDMFTLDTEYEYSKGGAKPVPVTDLINGKDYTLSYKNNTKTTEANKGVKASVTIKGKGNYQGSVVKEFTVVAKDISQVSVTAPDKVYTGKANAWKSAVTLTDSDGKKLAVGTDYNKEISYKYNGKELDKNDIVPSGGVITVTVYTAGAKANNYVGEVTGTYRIVDGDISKASIKVNAQVYTGREIEPGKDEITVILAKQELNEEDYDIVSYSNNINKGSGTIVLQGKGKYGGTKTVKFNIVQRNICQIIRFHGVADDVTGAMKDQYIFKKSKLIKNSYKRPGHSFLGWALTPEDAADKKVKYADNDRIDYNYKMAGDVTDLYAIWSD